MTQLEDNDSSNPLVGLEAFDPDSLAAETAPTSPPPPSAPARPHWAGPEDDPALRAELPAPILPFLSRLAELDTELAETRRELAALSKANARLEVSEEQQIETQERLNKSQGAHLVLERQLATVIAEVDHLRGVAARLDEVEKIRLKLERENASLTLRAERADKALQQLSEAQQALMRLEREKATLEVELKGLHKIEVQLAEERRARMNAQSRAAAAEANAARLEGEARSQVTGDNRSFWDRLRRR